MRLKVFAAAAVLLFFLSPFVLSQSKDTGAIEGTVTDAENAPLPGVTVTLTSPNLMGTRSALTDRRRPVPIPGAPAGDLRAQGRDAGLPDGRPGEHPADDDDPADRGHRASPDRRGRGGHGRRRGADRRRQVDRVRFGHPEQRDPAEHPVQPVHGEHRQPGPGRHRQFGLRLRPGHGHRLRHGRRQRLRPRGRLRLGLPRPQHHRGGQDHGARPAGRVRQLHRGHLQPRHQVRRQLPLRPLRARFPGQARRVPQGPVADDQQQGLRRATSPT